MASARSKKKATAPHLVEPQLKYVTDATFKDWHFAISRGFQEAPRPEELELDRQDLRQQADVRLQGRPSLGGHVR